MNITLITGNVGKQGIDFKNANNGTGIARFSVGVKKAFVREGENKNTYYNCVAFGKQAEFIANYFDSGSPIDLQLEYTPGSYENKEGVTVYTHDFTVKQVAFVPKDWSAQQQSSNNNSNSGNSDMMPVDDGIPF